MKKKLSLLAVTAAIVCATVPSAANALPANENGVTVMTESPGTWQTVGTHGATIKGGTSYKFPYAKSNGGDFAVRVTNNGTGYPLDLTLYETDNGGTSGIQVKSTLRVTSTGDAVWRDINDYLDYDNGQAEFYVVIKNTGPKDGYVSFSYLD